MRVAIVEDQPAVAVEILGLLKKTVVYHHSWKVDLFAGGSQLLFQYGLEEKPYDLVLMDIAMPILNGVETGKNIRRYDGNAVIIFITNYREYSLDAYQAHPYYYMLKPIREEEFNNIMEKACSVVRFKRQESIMIQTQKIRMRLPVYEISYVECRNHTLKIHTTAGRTVYCGKSLKKIQEEINKPFIYRIHRAYLVNLYEVAFISPTRKQVCLKSGAILSISKYKVKDFCDRFLEIHSNEGGGRAVEGI